MTLQNIKLPQIVIGNLYKNCLVDLYNEEKKPEQKNDNIIFISSEEIKISKKIIIKYLYYEMY